MPTEETNEPSTLAEMYAASQKGETTATETTTQETPETSQSQDESPEDETPEGDGEEATEEGDADEPADSGDTSIRDWIQANLKYDVSHYANDEEALAGIIEKARLSGAKDEDAQFGRTIRQMANGREQDLLEYLRSGKQPEAKPEAKSDKPEFDPEWLTQITQDKEGNYVPVPGAPKDVVEKVMKYKRWETNQLRQIVNDPEKFLESVLAKKTAEIEAKAQQRVEAALAQQHMAAAMQGWEAANTSILYVNGKDHTGGLTPIGQEIVRLDQELERDGITHPLTRLNRAKDIAMLKHKTTTPPKKTVPNKALRKPAIAPPAPTQDKTLDELFAESDADLLSVVMKLNGKTK